MKIHFKPIIISALVLVAFSATPTRATTSIHYEQRDIPTHVSFLGLETTTEGLFYDDLPMVPYITLDSYLGAMGETVVTSVSDGNYSLATTTNPNNPMVVNPENDTIYFANYTGFIRGDQSQGDGSQLPSYLKDPKVENIGEINPITLELKKYNLDLREENGKVYFPLSTLSDLFSISVYVGASYADGEITIAMLMDSSALLNFTTSSVWDSATRDQKLADFSYNELAFVMDYLYGKPAQGYLAETIEDKGFDRALKETNDETRSIYTLLHSNDMVEYFRGLYLLDTYLYDGGHTSLTAIYSRTPETSAFYDGVADVYRNQTSSVLDYTPATKAKESSDARDAINTARLNVLEDFEVKTWPEDDAGYYESGDTGIFIFDEFRDGVVKDFKWALDYAEQSGVKNFIIDLATNGGGSSGVVHYISSIITEGYQGIENLTMLNGNRVRSSFTIDKNLDGNFDELDDSYAPKLNFAILTSKLSFSCGNLLPSIAQDSGVVILGEQSGGGTCTSSRGFYPNGLPYIVSGFDCFVNSDGEQIDAGVRPNYLLSTYSGFYDFDSLSQKIHEFYGDSEAEEEIPEGTIPLAPNSGVGPLN